MLEIEKHVLRAKLAELATYVAFLRRTLPGGAAELEANLERRLAVLHAVQLAAQIVCDIALHIAAAESAGAPADYRAAVEDLGKRGIVPGDLAERLGRLAGLRNLIVHEYQKIDIALVHAGCVGGLGDVEAFAAAVLARYAL